jgi:hypothetical protein
VRSEMKMDTTEVELRALSPHQCCRTGHLLPQTTQLCSLSIPTEQAREGGGGERERERDRGRGREREQSCMKNRRTKLK